jgi:hypothetical protein
VGLAPVEVDGVAELDIFLRIGGSLDPAEDDAGVHHARYFESTKRFSANLVVPLSDIKTVGGAKAVEKQLLVLTDKVAARVTRGDPRACAELRGALGAAALQLES